MSPRWGWASVFAGDLVLGQGLAVAWQQGPVPAGPAPDGVCSVQAGYEVAPDEKRKECGQHLIEKYLKPKVSERTGFAACRGGTAGRLTVVIAHILPRCWAGG